SKKSQKMSQQQQQQPNAEESVFNRRFVAIGDVVLLKQRHGNTKTVRVTSADGTVQTVGGLLKFSDLIGRRYGSRLVTKRGFVRLLPLVPELWARALPHRTQILYPPDTCLIVAQLDLRPGRIVLEAGTGSAAFTHCLARTVMPTGRVLTFDFHAERAATAQRELTEHSLQRWAVCEHRDVCQLGFPAGSNADAVFLDLPQPWLTVPSLPACLRPGARFGSFSPCVQQAERTAAALRECRRFTDLIGMECHQRRYSLQPRSLPSADLGPEDDGNDAASAPAPEDDKEAPGKSTAPASKEASSLPLRVAATEPAYEQPCHSGFLLFATFYGPAE
ncbi:hypothetical protein BOX15_Mlig001228g13, partial [Macrostomum lignano]